MITIMLMLMMMMLIMTTWMNELSCAVEKPDDIPVDISELWISWIISATVDFHSIGGQGEVDEGGTGGGGGEWGGWRGWGRGLRQGVNLDFGINSGAK